MKADELFAAQSLAANIVLALVFFSAGASKLRRPQEFWNSLNGYRIGSLDARRNVALLVPILEIGAGLLWLSGRLPLVALTLTIVLLALFNVAMLVALRRGSKTDCGCSGMFSSARVGWAPIVRNCFVAVIAILAQIPSSGASTRVVDTISIVVFQVFVIFALEGVTSVMERTSQVRPMIAALTVTRS